jgi:hypothetical protein
MFFYLTKENRAEALQKMKFKKKKDRIFHFEKWMILLCLYFDGKNFEEYDITDRVKRWVNSKSRPFIKDVWRRKHWDYYIETRWEMASEERNLWDYFIETRWDNRGKDFSEFKLSFVIVAKNMPKKDSLFIVRNLEKMFSKKELSSIHGFNPKKPFAVVPAGIKNAI